jgi:hypothetical protein
MSQIGTSQTRRYVRYAAALGRQADIAIRSRRRANLTHAAKRKPEGRSSISRFGAGARPVHPIFEHTPQLQAHPVQH